MSNIYRLSANVFDRAEPYKDPRRVIWLSVEGKRTELNYFEYLNKYKNKLDIDITIQIEPLHRNDTNSDPESVLNLLDEYVMQRDVSILHQISSLSELDDTIGIEKIELYLYNPNKLSSEDTEIIKKAIDFAKYDVEYHKYLEKIQTENDIFAIIIDTEGKDNPSRLKVSSIIESCQVKGYKCFITNPCFEFFLLLHTCNPIKEYEANSELFINNPRISKTHTYLSKIISDRHNHKKKISEKKFVEIYLDNISTALENSKYWANTLEDVKDNVGTNMKDLFELLEK